MAEQGERAHLPEVAAALRAVLDGVSTTPDTTADPQHLAYLAGYADPLDQVAGSAEQADTRQS